jgi:hypothetical protein
MDIENNISLVRDRLTSHKIYSAINTLDELRLFMSAHVFAVWDFMSLVKRLQIEMTCTHLPWMIPKNAHAARLINEVVFYEETDLDLNGNPVSHMEMYLAAMEEVGADVSMITHFLAQLEKDNDVPQALEKASVPEYIASFVKKNLHCAMNHKVVEVASSFLFGREDAIPDMFTLFLEKWGIDRAEIPKLVYYLERHIELDADEHGPAAQKILNDMIDGDASKEELATNSAIFAIKNRIDLWDGILADIKANREKQTSAEIKAEI